MYCRGGLLSPTPEDMDYARRREQLMNRLGDGVLVLVAAPERQRSNDTAYRYRPSSDLLYLCGFDEPDAILVLAPKHPEHRVVLFVRPRNPEKEIWDGYRHGPEGAVERFGADAAFPIDELDERLPEYLSGRERLFYPLGEDPAFDSRLLGLVSSLRATRKKPDRAPHIIQDPRPILHRMRMEKDADEIALMSRAADISARAHVEAMRATRPGAWEYQVEAIIDGVFRSNGAYAPAYTNIVASGPGACILHYVENDRRMQDGELLLVDAGCELDWYAADITRTWPVGGRFSGPQRAVYQLVLDAQVAAIAEVRTGTSNHEIQDHTVRHLTTGMVDLGLLSGDVDALIEDESYKRFYMHGIGHYLGMDVHDVGVYLVEEDVGEPLVPGTVVTIEPGIYIAPDDETVPEEFRGIGVRIEDDVVVTDGEPLILTDGVPKAIDEVEALCGELS